MDDKKHKQLMRLFTFAWFSVLVLLVVLLLVSHDSNQKMRQYIDGEIKNVRLQVANTDVPQHITGKDGADGQDGKDGANGKNGQDGVTTLLTVHETVVTPGQKGDKGDKGEPGVSVDIRVNPQTGDIEKYYGDDDFGEVLIPCGLLLKGCTGGSTAE